LHRNECGAKNGGGRLLRAECRTLMDEQVAQFQDGIVEIVLAPESRAPRASIAGRLGSAKRRAGGTGLRGYWLLRLDARWRTLHCGFPFIARGARRRLSALRLQKAAVE
jgi:hypothetical protein